MKQGTKGTNKSWSSTPSCSHPAWAGMGWKASYKPQAQPHTHTHLTMTHPPPAPCLDPGPQPSAYGAFIREKTEHHVLWPGLEECAWSTADYSVELSAKKVLICASLCVCVCACVCVQYLHVSCLYGSNKNVCICWCVHISARGCRKKSFTSICI